MEFGNDNILKVLIILYVRGAGLLQNENGTLTHVVILN